MPAVQFALIQNTLSFTISVHPGIVEYDNPTVYTTNQQQTEQK